MKEVIEGNPELELPPKERLATPHFDEMAIAEARPVQPLPQRPGNAFRILRTLLRTPRKLAMLIVATAVLIAVVGLSIGTNREVDPVQPASAEVESAEVESKTESRTSEKLVDSQPILERRAPVSRGNRRSTRLFESPAYGALDGKPVARKVGEIRN